VQKNTRKKIVKKINKTIEDSNKPLIFPALAELDQSYADVSDQLEGGLGEITEAIKGEHLGVNVTVADKAQKSKINSILKLVPLHHLKDNAGINSIVVSDDEDFLAKHNDESGTIHLSKKIFTPEYNKNRPYHRIEGIPSLTELLVHEIGHAVEQNLHTKNKKIIDPLWHRVTGWKYPKNKEHVTRLKDEGYVSAFSSFKKTPEKDLATLEANDISQIESRIKRRYPMQLPDKKMKISWYGVTSPREDFAESYTRYVLDVDRMKAVEPNRYNYMKNYIFKKGEGNES